MTTAKKAAAKKAADDEPKASERHTRKPSSPEREAEIDAGLRLWSQAQRTIEAIEANLADENLLPRDRERLQRDLATAVETQGQARAQIAGTA